MRWINNEWEKQANTTEEDGYSVLYIMDSKFKKSLGQHASKQKKFQIHNVIKKLNRKKNELVTIKVTFTTVPHYTYISSGSRSIIYLLYYLMWDISGFQTSSFSSAVIVIA